METLAQRWWVLALRGLFAIIFGILTFVMPGSSLIALVILFGAYALVDGAFNLVHAIRGRRTEPRWGWLVFEGLVGMAAGAVTFLWPGLTAFALVLVIGAWAIVTGVAALVAAVRLRKEIEGEWLLGGSGILSIALGVLLFLFPGSGALALVLWIGAYAVVAGILLLVLGFKLRSLRGPSTGEPQRRRQRPLTTNPPPTPA
jgi:uncharacterized membrane protein HdeD (DUF308 family)